MAVPKIAELFYVLTAMCFDFLQEILDTKPDFGTTVKVLRWQTSSSFVERCEGKYIAIERGAFRVYATKPNGGKVNLSIIGEGYVLSPAGLEILADAKSHLHLEALQNTTLRVINTHDWQMLCRVNTDLNNWVVDQEAHQLQIVKFHLTQIIQRCSMLKARFALSAYADGVGKLLPCGAREINVSRRELATWIGVSSDRMGRMIRDLSDAGEIELRGRSIRVRNCLYEKLSQNISS